MEKESFGILVPISLGELVDKITILEIKASKLTGSPRENVQRELSALSEIFDAIPLRIDKVLLDDLRAVNRELWDVENMIRDCDKNQEFGTDFVNLSKAVYAKNDLRASLKRQINIKYGSMIIEEKSYENFD